MIDSTPNVPNDDEVRLNAIQRPDGAWMLRLPQDQPDTWPALLKRAETIDGEVRITLPDDLSPDSRAALESAGFKPVRQEIIWRMPVAEILQKPRVRTRHNLVQVTDLDPADVAALDNIIRHDIPGTEHWEGTTEDLLESLEDDEFDPELYRVAQHTETGSLDGLIRVWNRSPYPRVGCLGVTRRWRRTRLALALVQEVAQVLHDRGVTHIITETDSTNRDSGNIARRQGGEAIRIEVEWQRPARQ